RPESTGKHQGDSFRSPFSLLEVETLWFLVVVKAHLSFDSMFRNHQLIRRRAMKRNIVSHGSGSPGQNERPAITSRTHLSALVIPRFLAAALLVIFELIGPTNTAALDFSVTTNYPVGSNPVSIAVEDFNHDGRPDLVVANAGNQTAGDNGSITILLGNGNGTFQPAANFDGGKNPWSIAVGDFNHDSNQDLAVADGGETSLSIMLGK